MAGAIETIDFVHVGRPKNEVKFCKVCGIELTFETARETRKGSGSLRSTCRECERQQDNERKKAKYKRKHRKLVSRGPAFSEKVNRVGMAAQSGRIETICRPDKEPKQIIVFEDSYCEECGGLIRYDERVERVCSECGLVDSLPVINNQPGSELAGRQLKSYEKTKYDLALHANRDGEYDALGSDNYSIFDKYYAKAYEKVLKTGKKPERKPTKKEILEDDDSLYPRDMGYGKRIKKLLDHYTY